MTESSEDGSLKADKGIVLIIDEVDSATNNQVFLDFLAQLRDGYISTRYRWDPGIPVCHPCRGNRCKASEEQRSVGG